MTIHEAIPKIMSEVGVVGKDHRNKGQGGGYAYRSIDDVVAALQPLMAKYGVHARPVVKDWRCEQVQVGQDGKRMMHVTGIVEYHVAAADGTEVVCSAIAEAFDSGDKAGNKAMAAAQKYALTQTFCIPTKECKDTEAETHELAPAHPAAKPLVDITGLRSDAGDKWLRSFTTAQEAIAALAKSRTITDEAHAYITELFEAVPK